MAAGGGECRDERRESSASEVGTADGTEKKRKKITLDHEQGDIIILFSGSTRKLHQPKVTHLEKK